MRIGAPFADVSGPPPPPPEDTAASGSGGGGGGEPPGKAIDAQSALLRSSHTPHAHICSEKYVAFSLKHTLENNLFRKHWFLDAVCV